MHEADLLKAELGGDGHQNSWRNDIVLASEDLEELQTMLEQLNVESIAVGLEINLSRPRSCSTTIYMKMTIKSQSMVFN